MAMQESSHQWTTNCKNEFVDNRDLEQGFVKAINQIIEIRDTDRLQRIIDEGSPLQRIRAEQMMGIINEGVLKTYVPELAQLVITEVTVHGVKKYTFVFMEGSKVTVIL